MSKNCYNFIDLFSGCGGFSSGLEMAGHNCLLGVDFDASAIESFKENHKNAHSVCMDIHKLTKKKLQSYIDIDQVDMVVGGPPCQGFSTVGRGKADDQRNSLFEQFIRIVRLTNPKIILFENVTGILAKKNEKIFTSFEKLGYQMDAKVMSADFYGVPSRRRRTIIMGVKGGEPRFPKEAFGPTKKYPLVTVKEALTNLKAKNGRTFNHDLEKTLIANPLDHKRLKYIPPGQGIRYEKDEKKYLPKKLRYDLDWDQISEKRFRQTRLQRIPWDDVAPTILTSRTMYYHPIEVRFLTAREAASCQSFPNDFIFKGSTTAQFRQIGNAVPPLLAKYIGKEIKKIEFNMKVIQKIKIEKNQKPKFFEKAFTYKERKTA